MAEKEFHEAFWVVVGTAGPVFLVASVVAVTQSAQVVLRAVEAQAFEKTIAWRARWRVLPKFSPIGTSLVWALVSMVADVVVVTQSLVRLSNKDDVGKSWVMLLTAFAVLCLAAQTMALINASLIVRRHEIAQQGADARRQLEQLQALTTRADPTRDAVGRAAHAGTAATTEPTPRDRSSGPRPRPRPAPPGRPADA